MRPRKPQLAPAQIKELQKTAHQTKDADESRRAQAILMLELGSPEKDIVSFTGYHLDHVFRIRSQYRKEGAGAIQDKRKGKPRELLAKKERESIVRILGTKTPRETDSRYESEYWTTGILGDYIFRKYAVRYKSKTSYYLIFRRAEFTYHKPGRVYHERNEEEVEQWKNETKPRIQSALRNKNAIILAEDEMILKTQTTTQKIWLKQGEYPKIEVSHKRENRSIYGFLNIGNGREHAWKTERQNMEITKNILERIRKIYPTQKILLLWDSAGWHKGRAVTEFIKQDGRVEIIHFPRYDPEDNPQEHVWKQGRSEITHNRFIEDIDAATDEFVAYLNKSKFPYEFLGLHCVS